MKLVTYLGTPFFIAIPKQDCSDHCRLPLGLSEAIQMETARQLLGISLDGSVSGKSSWLRSAISI